MTDEIRDVPYADGYRSGYRTGYRAGLVAAAAVCTQIMDGNPGTTSTERIANALLLHAAVSIRALAPEEARL